MTDKWCEHDEVAAECVECKLRLAEATNELLSIRLARVLEVLERARTTVILNARVSTHWAGCEDSHPFCALLRDIENVTRGEDDATDRSGEARSEPD